MTPTPEELDEAVGLAARTLEGQDSIEQIRQALVVDDMLGLECEDSIALERLIASNATNAPPLARAVLALAAENERLTATLNTPITEDFSRGVEAEAAHQRDRWGSEHDAGKRPEDWIALCVYLLGKATKAHYEGDSDKYLHHLISTAAVLANAHAHETGVDTRMRPGVSAEHAWRPAQTGNDGTKKEESDHG